MTLGQACAVLQLDQLAALDLVHQGVLRLEADGVRLEDLRAVLFERRASTSEWG